MARPDKPALTYPLPPAGRRAAHVRRLGLDRLWRRDPARAWRLARLGAAPVLTWLAPGSAAYGVERIPAHGGVVLAANHFTALDPFLVGIPAGRAVHFFGKGQLFRRSLLTEAILWLGAIPVGRHADNRAALRHATDLLRAGRVVGIFVEGARQRSGEMGEAMPGAALLAQRAGMPVVPCGLDTFGWSRRSRRPCVVVFGEPQSRRSRRPCVVVFGEPLELDGLPVGREGIELATERIAAAVEEARLTAASAAESGRPAMLADGSRRSGWRDVWLDAVRHRARS